MIVSMWGAPPPPRRQCWKVWSAKVGAKKTAISAQKRRSDISSALYLGGWGGRPEDEHQVYGRYFCTYRGEVPSRMLLINVLLGNVKVASMSQEHTQRSRPQPRSLSCPPPSVGQQPSPSSVLASSVTASGRSEICPSTVHICTSDLQARKRFVPARYRFVPRIYKPGTDLYQHGTHVYLCFTSQNGFVPARYKFVPRFYRQGSGLYLSRRTTFILLLNETEVQIRSSAACWAHQEQ